jgi:hypothetical protein
MQIAAVGRKRTTALSFTRIQTENSNLNPSTENKSVPYREPRWHDPIVVGFCILLITPIMFYGLISGFMRELRRGRQPNKCKQIKGGLTDEEIEQLKKFVNI